MVTVVAGDTDITYCRDCSRCCHLTYIDDRKSPEDRQFCVDCQCRPEVITIWAPLTRVGTSGGICYLGGSHRIDQPIPAEILEHDNIQSELPPNFEERAKKLQWAVGAFEVGDVAVHNVRTVHASSPPPPDSGMRISLELRVMIMPRRSNIYQTKPTLKVQEEGTLIYTTVAKARRRS